MLIWCSRTCTENDEISVSVIQIAGQLGGRAVAKLACFLGMPVSHYIILKLLIQVPDQPISHC